MFRWEDRRVANNPHWWISLSVVEFMFGHADFLPIILDEELLVTQLLITLISYWWVLST